MIDLCLIAQAVFTAPLPGSAAMGIALIGGVAMFARFPSSRRKRRLHPRNRGLGPPTVS